MDDLISRQAAIDVADAVWSVTGDKNVAKVWGQIKDLPSAQLELANNSPKVGKENGEWIPCSERLPEHGGCYLISVLDNINRRTTVAPYLPRCKAWTTMTGHMAYWKVIAWMPLPEPYKEEQE